MKLEQLTDEQTKLMFQVRDEWMSLAFDGHKKGIDKPKFEQGVKWLYETILEKPMPKVVYCSSWISCILTIDILKKMSNSEKFKLKIGKAIDAQVDAQVWAQVGAQVDAQVWDQVDAQVGDQVDAQVGAQVRAQVWAQVWDQVRDQVWDQVRAQKDLSNIFGEYSTRLSWSNWGWVSFHDFFDRIGVTSHSNFREFKSLLQSNCFMAYEYEGFIFAIQPPVEIQRNESGQLHNPAGEAVKFMDGSGCWFINGRSVPQKLFNGFTKEDFMNETNEDIRGAMFEIIEAKGEGSMLAFLEAAEFNRETIVHASDDLEELILYRTDKSFPELQDLNGKSNVPLCWLRFVCPSTGQQYLINTDASFKTASEAAKFHRPEEVPFDLDYSWHSRN